MQKIGFITILLLLFLSVAGFALPQPAMAAVVSIDVEGTCSGATVTVTFSDVNPGDWQDTIITAFIDGGANLDASAEPIDDATGTASATLSWDELADGTVVTISADQFRYLPLPGEFIDLKETTYTCRLEPVAEELLPGIYPPETKDRVYITSDMSVFHMPSFDYPIRTAPTCENKIVVEGVGVCAGQEFPPVDQVEIDGVTWFQIFIGGAEPWVPSTGAYLYTLE